MSWYGKIKLIFSNQVGLNIIMQGKVVTNYVKEGGKIFSKCQMWQ